MLKQEILDQGLAPVRSAQAWSVAAAACACVVAAASDGMTAVAATAIGASVGWLAGRSLSSGAAAAVAEMREPRRAHRLALLAALLRYPVLGSILAAAVMALDLPAGWIAVGITTWPASLLAAALLSQGREAAAPRG